MLLDIHSGRGEEFLTKDHIQRCGKSTREPQGIVQYFIASKCGVTRSTPEGQRKREVSRDIEPVEKATF
jgi:hypothetical protein